MIIKSGVNAETIEQLITEYTGCKSLMDDLYWQQNHIISEFLSLSGSLKKERIICIY